MKYEENIEKVKKGFEISFSSDIYYNKQTQDQNHLSLIVNSLQVEAGMKILDLGTGTGYLAFPIAEKYPLSEVIGLDIVEQTLIENQKRVELAGLNNLHFINYEGLIFPFDDNSFDIVITRYALHHFPMIDDTFCEINRVLKKNGTFLLSDPAPNENDITRFVDDYMQMKKDGHLKFYTKQEWNEIGKLSGFNLVNAFETTIRFPRKRETAIEIDDIINHHDDTVISSYEVEIIDDEIWITEKVNNLLFQKIRK